MLSCQRALFKIPDEVAYLNCAYMSPQMRQVELAGRDTLAKKNQPWLVQTEDFFLPGSELKALFARLIGVRERDRIAIIPSVSYGLANAAFNAGLKQGDHVLVAEGQFPSNYYIWERLCREKGAHLTVVPAPVSNNRGKDWNQAILEAIDDRVRVVALGHVHWADGTLFDLPTIRKRTREAGALLIIDGTQSVGALPFDVETIQPDALVCAGYKWLMGPYSIGVAYYGEAFDSGTPIEENWINREGSEYFANLVQYRPEYKPLASRYAMGEQSQFVLAPMLKTGVEQLLDWGCPEIQAYCRNLTEPAIAQIKALGCWVEDSDWRGSHLFGVRLGQDTDPDKLKSAFAAHKVMVSFRGNAIRVAAHVYNTPEDLEKLVHCFQEAQQ
ncbi:MAG: aminotransferase class V-fold PLP-dependent enzyme [Haliscomenobacter sp.]|nr:aminotransferase class V-fold PLP-dependent enzyme [Haliscomenobacter sp.]MBK8653586.1 aminotransferase class V-fold PLP-dependent enzyme [Haliscomenobacter sp.]